jgi:excinuclease UvrABC ATPase subunit
LENKDRKNGDEKMSIQNNEYFFESDRVIWRETTIIQSFRIPDGFTKCLECKGTGKIIKIYRDPGPNETMLCFECKGKGFIPETVKT